MPSTATRCMRNDDRPTHEFYIDVLGLERVDNPEGAGNPLAAWAYRLGGQRPWSVAGPDGSVLPATAERAVPPCRMSHSDRLRSRTSAACSDPLAAVPSAGKAEELCPGSAVRQWSRATSSERSAWLATTALGVASSRRSGAG